MHKPFEETGVNEKKKQAMVSVRNSMAYLISI
jgi:hypothetical protein